VQCACSLERPPQAHVAKACVRIKVSSVRSTTASQRKFGATTAVPERTASPEQIWGYFLASSAIANGRQLPEISKTDQTKALETQVLESSEETNGHKADLVDQDDLPRVGST
jgi:hypothetical protein